MPKARRPFTTATTVVAAVNTTVISAPMRAKKMREEAGEDKDAKNTTALCGT